MGQTKGAAAWRLRMVSVYALMVSLSNQQHPLILRQAQDEREEYVSLRQGLISPG